MKKDGCCKKKEEMKGSCSTSDEQQHCGRPADEENTPADLCPIPADQVCVCICCFQFAAPDQVGTKFQFGTTGIQQSLGFYLHQKWKDPMLALPWQPPDC